MYNSNFLAIFLLFSFLLSGCKVRNDIYNDSVSVMQGGVDMYLPVPNLQGDSGFLETDLPTDNSFITTDYLKWAIRNNDLHLANALLKKGVNIDINTPCEGGLYLLQSVVKSGNKDMVEFILKNFNDVDINIKGYGNIVSLAIAVMNGYKDIVNLLLENGADYNIPNKECMLPFHMAAVINNVDILKIFLENGIDVDIKVPKSNCGTALNYAHMAASKESIGFLIDHGANINDVIKTIPLNKPTRTELKNRIKFIDTSRGQEYLTLGIAIQDQEVDFIKLLLETFKHININSKDTLGYTPLHHAAVIGNLEVVKLLLEHGADPSIKDDRYGVTPLNLAAENGHKDVVEELSSHKKSKSFFSSWW